MAKSKSKDGKQAERRERRFLPQSSVSPLLVRSTGGLGAALLGAGAWGHFYGHLAEGDQPSTLVVGAAAAGFVLTGVAIWLGTSGDPALRVGDGGVALEKGELRRVPWYAIESIRWDEGALALVVRGVDEAKVDTTVRVPIKTQPHAAAWLAAEAKRRIPERLDVSEAVLEQLPAASPHAGTVLLLDPVQVVGRKCAQSSKTISYEPDARLCTRCEQVFHKDHVPARCTCGARMDGKGEGKRRAKATDDGAAEASA